MGIDEKIKAWKEEHKSILMLETEDGKTCYLKDPIHDINVTKAAIVALRKTDFDLVDTILTNCWLEGDEEIRKEEAYVVELSDQIKDLLELPKCTCVKTKDGFELRTEGVALPCRTAMRADIVKAEKRNPDGAPLTTAEYLLRYVALDPDKLEEIRKGNTKAYIGLLVGVDKVKNKKEISIKKL